MSVLLIGAALGSVFGGKVCRLLRPAQIFTLPLLYFSYRRPAFRRSSRYHHPADCPRPAGLRRRRRVGHCPTFISEVAPTEMRGKLTGLNEVAIVIGQLAAFAINAIIGIIWGHLPDVWRYMLLVQAIPCCCLFVGMWRAPESPRWLISKKSPRGSAAYSQTDPPGGTRAEGSMTTSPP